ncbi:UDP-2,4-diacetamido-2,4,6-trideoxy-beta-L-altropyranose hydrolase [Labrenzia sp. OB1]|uniref:UDP-2,4-diacetamido-2,4, 6-trideoxy-beta-L-altropyranose hydrolase n=1 Tax=Labrenzia sp. OB1 TaxID=1561204 RepID=UPI0007B178EE|nr:UDP-2,4-diacetamido-2,4,6-trideoxy-beta-L-altropyranose hydrolase [Labrenzia sp. OB1]KZM49933.1 hypothetical protein OA90_10930 [Labrenzia sp. OB1]
MSRRIGFRVDAGVTLGGGHVMRCLTLARAFRARGHSCVFLSSPETLEVIPPDMWDGVDVRTIEVGETGDLAGRFDLLVFDHYGLAAPEESQWRARAGTLLVIDDLADRPHDCDVLLDQTYGVQAADYKALVPFGCRMLLGSGYALLREEFALNRAAALCRRANSGKSCRVLVSLGMTDVGGIAGRICGLLKELGGIDRVDVVLGRKAPSYAFLEEICTADVRFQVHSDVRNMAKLMLACDVAVGAGGTTTWERCALGLPSLVVILADNQIKIADLMNRAGAIGLIGDARTSSDRDLFAGLTRFLNDAEHLRQLGRTSAELCDGSGTRRVAERVLQLVAERERAYGQV